MTASKWKSSAFSKSRYGFNSAHGAMSITDYRNSTIQSFYSVSNTTTLIFTAILNDQSEIKVKVNGALYTLTKSSDTTWKCDTAIFTSSGTYEIEFLN